MQLLFAALLLVGQDTSEAAKIVVQHDGRLKPLDTFARQLMQSLTDKERFEGYKDASGRFVQVFPGGDPVYAVLKMIAQPADVRDLRFIKINHPTLRKKWGLDENLTYYSLADLQGAREHLRTALREIDPEDATSDQIALLKVDQQIRSIESLHREELFAIVPVLFGENRTWMTPTDIRRWLSGKQANDRRSVVIAEALTSWTAKDATRRAALQSVSDAYVAAMKGFTQGDLSGFGALARGLRELNPAGYPEESRIATELGYNRIRPFHWAGTLWLVVAVGYLMALVFESRKLGWVVWVLQLGAVLLMAYGYVLRYQISGRHPLSNHYESMIACAMGAGLVALILETFFKPQHILGLSGALVAWILVALANSVPTFAEQGFMAPLVPALNTFWMAIHVPVIMLGYAMGMVLAVLAHIHLIKVLARRSTAEWESRIDRVLYRVLQLCVLFLLCGIILGAVWAGEAWGRPWGWDMKETWALITLLCYIAILHARFMGALRPFGTSVCALIAFQVMILTYYGVNFVFGKGLHSYGRGSGDVYSLVGFAIAEALFLGAVFTFRGSKEPPPATPQDFPVA
jgi:cytochrome c-type biogenesis protein CcsB